MISYYFLEIVHDKKFKLEMAGHARLVYINIWEVYGNVFIKNAINEII